MNRFTHNIFRTLIAVTLLANATGPVFAAPVPVNDAKTTRAKSVPLSAAAPSARQNTVSFIVRERNKPAPPSIVPPIVGFNDIVHGLSSPALFYAAENGVVNQKYSEVPATVAATALGGLLARPFPRSGIPQVRAPYIQDAVLPVAFANNGEPSLTEVMKLNAEFDRILAELDAAAAKASGIALVKLHLAKDLVRLKRDLNGAFEKHQNNPEAFAAVLSDARARFRNALRNTLNELFGVVVKEMDAGDASTRAILSLFTTLLETATEAATFADVQKPPEQWASLTTIVDTARRKLTGTLPDKTSTSKKMFDKLTEKGFYKLLALLDQLPARFDDIVYNLGQIYDKLQALRKVVDAKQAEIQRGGSVKVPALRGDVRQQFEAIIKRFLSDDVINANTALRQIRGIIKNIIADNVKKQIEGLYGFDLTPLAAKLNDPRITGSAYNDLLFELRDAAVAVADASVKSKETFWFESDYERYIAAIVEFQINGELFSRFLRLLENYDDPVKVNLLFTLYNDAVKAVVSRYGNSPFQDIVGPSVIQTLRGLSKYDENMLNKAKEKVFRAIGQALQGDAPEPAGETAAGRAERERRNAEIKALKQLFLLVDMIVGNVTATLQDLEKGEMRRIQLAQAVISNIAAAIEAQGDAILAKMKEQLGQSSANRNTRVADAQKRKTDNDTAAKKAKLPECPNGGGGGGGGAKVWGKSWCPAGYPVPSAGSAPGGGDCFWDYCTETTLGDSKYANFVYNTNPKINAPVYVCGNLPRENACLGAPTTCPSAPIPFEEYGGNRP